MPKNALDSRAASLNAGGMHREILRLAGPNILSNLSIPLLGMVDTALMGRLESEVYIGAIALGSILFNFIYWGFGFLRMGTTGMTAQAFGAGDDREGTAIMGRGLLVALAGSGLLIALQGGLAWIGFGLLQGDADVERLARSYFLIRIYAAPATLCLYVLHGWFLGMQNARYPMILTVFVNLLNIGFNLLFVFRFGMKADGVALGTVFAQWLGLGLGIRLLLRRYRPRLRLFDWARVKNWLALRRFFAINGDIFVRTMLLVFSFAFFTSASAAVDSLTLAANQILLQYQMLMSYGVDGFAFAAESLVGRFKGEGDRLRMRNVVRRLLVWGGGLGGGFGVFYLVFGKPLLAVFTDQAAVIAAAAPYIPWQAAISLAGAVAFLWDGIFIGATASAPLRNSMLIATLAVFLPAYYLLFPALGNHGLWLAMLLFMIARGVLLGRLAPRWIFSLEPA